MKFTSWFQQDAKLMTMTKFVVKLGDEIIGYSELEYGDPSMGCAEGKLVPTAAYSSIQQYCIEHSPEWEPIPSLAVCLPDGSAIECSGGIQIWDLSAVGETGLRIAICGIPHPLYAELFPSHMAEYHKRWSSDSK
ncbi:MAG TPA: hypothetical protein VFR24_05035 [Candidatus Angelobacter sp.]|nr:hypothetical protein [Candidatus Angelobacter sp.]